MIFSIQHFDTISSTNLYLKEHASHLPTYQVVCAKEQTAGRGRLGRQFVSPESGLYFSLLLRPDSIEKALIIPIIAGLSTACGLCKMTDVMPELKWPNDVLMHGKKVCGMLAETAPDGSIIMGIGVNLLASRDYFDALHLPHVSSIWLETKRRIDRLALLSAILEQIEYWLSVDTDALMKEYKAHCVTLQKEVTVSTGLCGTAVDIAKNGELIVRDELGALHSLNSGEVSISGMY